MAQLQTLESDLDLVVQHSKRKSVREVTAFLSSEGKDQNWTGGVFETFVKARLLREKVSTVELDWSLPNGKEADVRMGIAGRPWFLECTVLTDSDEDRKAWQEYCARWEPDEVGVFGPKMRNAYYPCLRIYLKVYDKIAPKLDPSKGQLPGDAPGVLLLSCDTLLGEPSATDATTGWALDELLAAQAKSGPATRCERGKGGRADISLVGWLEHHANDLLSKDEIDAGSYCQRFQEIIGAPRKIGAIFLFDGCSLKASRINYNALPGCALTHRDMAGLEDLFATQPGWAAGR